MKKLLFAMLAATSLAGAAQATTYNIGVTADPYRQAPATSGLQTRTVVLSPSGPQEFTGATYDITLANIGDTFTQAVFGIVSFDAPIDADDLLPRPSTATFTIGTNSATILGESYAVSSQQSLPSNFGSAFVDYFAPVIIRVGPALAIVISLADTVFATDGAGNFTTGRPGFAPVNATFTLAAIPVPAGLPLALTGLGLLGFVARRRKLKGTTALAA